MTGFDTTVKVNHLLILTQAKLYKPVKLEVSCIFTKKLCTNLTKTIVS